MFYSVDVTFMNVHTNAHTRRAFACCKSGVIPQVLICVNVTFMDNYIYVMVIFKNGKNELWRAANDEKYSIILINIIPPYAFA